MYGDRCTQQGTAVVKRCCIAYNQAREVDMMPQMLLHAAARYAHQQNRAVVAAAGCKERELLSADSV